MLAVTGVMPVGGSSTFLINLARGMQELGYRLPVAVMSDHVDYRRELAAAGGLLHEMSRTDTIYEDRIQQVLAIINDYRPALVLAALSSESFEILRYLPDGVKRVGIVQSDDEKVYQMAANYAPWIDSMVGVSSAIGQRLAGMQEFHQQQVISIPYGIHFEHSRTATDSSIHQPLRVIYAGRISEDQKRISRIAEVIGRLANASSGFEFTIVGDGPEAGWLQDQVGGLPGVKLLGRLDNQATIAEFAAQDVFLLLSDYEGLPLALLEAMGMGCVPVVSDLESGIGELVNDDCGITIPLGDIDHAVTQLKRLESDRELLSRLSSNASSLVRKKYSATRMARAYLDLAESTALQIPDWDSWAAKKPAINVPLLVNKKWLYSPLLRVIRRTLKVIK